jgi:hypothetical protein
MGMGRRQREAAYGGRTRDASGVVEKGGEGVVQCLCTCRVEPVGPAVAAGHRRLRPDGRQRGWRGHGV